MLKVRNETLRAAKLAIRRNADLPVETPKRRDDRLDELPKLARRSYFQAVRSRATVQPGLRFWVSGLETETLLGKYISAQGMIEIARITVPARFGKAMLA